MMEWAAHPTGVHGLDVGLWLKKGVETRAGRMGAVQMESVDW